MNKLIERIDATTAHSIINFGSLSSDELNWKPNAESWSIAQNIDHLMVINNSYFEAFNALKSNAYQLPFVGKIGWLVHLFGKVVLKGVSPDRKKKIKTFPIWEPDENEIQADIIQKFSEHQNELKKHLLAMKNMAAKGIVMSSPANKNIVYRLDMAFEIIVTHEQRHLAQSKEILALMHPISS